MIQNQVAQIKDRHTDCENMEICFLQHGCKGKMTSFFSQLISALTHFFCDG